ncbi:hypothetical protein [Achromobacter marplatensis]|uniref:hypothetical protein n=1 Tax=Achromobacter marplatensis TaxID=470868 RepID=UPI0039F6F2EC
MEPANHLRFAVRDRINGIDVGPKHVPLNLLGEFQKDVSDFLQGSTREVNPAEVLVSIDEGSLVLVATGLLGASMLWSDVAQLANPGSLSAIDPKRATVIERWQAQARSNPNRIYRLENAANRPLTTINAQSDFKQSVDIWVTVEKYLHGKIVDWGGKTKANVHLVLENGKSLTVAATQQLLAQESENRLYRSALLHVTAEENLRTGELRNLNLRSFEAHHPAYDEDEFQQMVRKGTAAWADVSNATQWVESLRGDDT